MIVKNKYEQVLNQFEVCFPHFYSRAVDWWASGYSSISVQLNTGEILDYDRTANTIRWIKTGENEVDDEYRRKAFGRNLEKTIPFTGMTKGEIAERLGISNTMMSRYLRGKTMPSVDKAYQLARMLGCTVDELFDETYITQSKEEL